jgi:ELWxxDGT repeat protein
MGTYVNNGSTFSDPALSFSEALNTSLANYIGGSLNSTPSIFRDSIGGGDSYDTYKFTLSSSSIVSLDLSQLTSNADLYLFDSSFGSILSSTKTGTTPDSINVALTSSGATDYYVRVYSTSASTSYDLSFAATPIQDSGRFTTDNSTGTAFVTPQLSNNNLTYNTIDFVGQTNSTSNSSVVQDSNDFYKISLATSGSLNISLSGLTANADLALLTSPVQISSQPGNNPESLVTGSLASGTYYIYVYANTSTSNFTNYNLNVAFTPDPVDNGGNSLATATSIDNTVFSTTDFVSAGDTQDYYKLDLTSLTNSDALVNITLQPTSANADLKILNASGVEIQSSSQLGTNPDSIRRSLTKGTYYVLVSSVSGASTNYQLNVTTQKIDPDQAQNTQNTGSTIANVSNYNISDFAGNIDQNDFYTFTLNNSSQFRLNLSNLSDNVGVELYDASRTVNQTASGSAVNNNVNINTSLNAGTYYIRIYTNLSPLANTFYNLSLSTNPTTQKFDLNIGSGSSNPDNLTALGNNLYFTAEVGSAGSQLWRVSGNTPTQLTSINPGGFNPGNLKVFGSNLYFTATDNRGTELWVYNGNTASLFSDINLTGSSNPSELTVVGSQLFFTANDGTGKKVWVYNGSSVSLVSGIYSDPTNLTVFDGKLYFTAFTPSNGNELWSSNGSSVSQVADITPGSASSSPTNLTAVGNKLYFATDAGLKLWNYTSGAPAPTLLKDLTNIPSLFAISYLTSAGSTLYFAVDSDGNGQSELWKSDGTPAGTVQVKSDSDPQTEDSYSLSFSFDQRYLAAIGNTLYLSVPDTANGWELWKTDGTGANTGIVKDIWPGTDPASSFPYDSIPENLVNFGGTLYFAAADNSGKELWRSDGTALGTSKVSNIYPNGQANPAKLTVVGTRLFFTATDGSTGTELYVI